MRRPELIELKRGWRKIRGACEVAQQQHGLDWLWDDTCCIDKSNSVELSEAINSMFDLYRSAQLCLAYLGDVPGGEEAAAEGSFFRRSRWFRRGWTLQELIASDASIVFLSSDWVQIGTTEEEGLAKVVEEITGIDYQLLMTPLEEYRIVEVRARSIAERMSWAAGRETTRPEDRAYSLMGIFDVNMPIIYGEGGEKAFHRLQLEIIRRSSDLSIFAWGRRIGSPMSLDDVEAKGFEIVSSSTRHGLLAGSPDHFQAAKDIVTIASVAHLTNSLGIPPVRKPHFYETNHGIRIQLPVRPFHLDHGLNASSTY
ncbi:hypothetical protein C8Q70DRAFT_1052290 [Cubamyces menziesii]|nr:hypothetical protein C8Q70DRAFT_1052290 [Cubamyces menziesii]